MESLRQRFLAHLDERSPSCGEPRHHPLVFGFLVLCLFFALLLAASFPYHHYLAAPLAPLGVALLSRGISARIERTLERKRAASRRQTIERGVAVTAYPVWTHERLERPGIEPHPALALVTFDADAARDSDWLRYLAHRCPVKPSAFHRYRRRALPLSQTDGYTVYVIDLDVFPGYLEDGYVSGVPLPCLAEPGERGGIELIPYWLVFPIQGGPRPQERGERV
jgi:hypothetical protein